MTVKKVIESVVDESAVALDVGEINAAGFWKTGIRFARSGIYLYPPTNPVVSHLPVAMEGRDVRVLRPDDEVFDAQSMASFEYVPVSDEHKGGTINAANSSQLMRGFAQAPVVRDGDGLRVPIVVTDAELIRSARTGQKAEASAGYSCDIYDVSGNDEQYGEYDAVMRNIRGNHIALVSRGRAGPQFRVTDEKETESMKRIYKGVSVELGEQGAEVFDAIVAERDAAVAAQKTAETERDAAKTAADKADAERDAAKVALDKASAPADAAELDRMVDERVAIRERARELAPEIAFEVEDSEGNRKSKSNDELIREAVATATKLPLDGKSAEYVRAVFDTLVVGPPDRKRVLDAAGGPVKSPAAAAREKFIKEGSGR